MEISDRAVENILGTWPVGVLSTYGRESIHSVPIVFVPVDGDVYTPVDGKPKSGRRLQRIVDIERDPRFTLLLQNYSEDWTELWWLRLSGRAGIVADDEADGSTERVVACLRAKYVPYEQTTVLAGAGELIRLTLSAQTAWAWQGVDWLERRFTR